MSSSLTQVDVLTAILSTKEGILPVGRHEKLVVSKLLKSFRYIRIIVEIKKSELPKIENTMSHSVPCFRKMKIIKNKIKLRTFVKSSSNSV
jgi:hypothetical protein